CHTGRIHRRQHMNFVLKTVVPTIAALLFAAVPIAVQGQTYPDKPVRIVVPYPPGGSADAVTRMLSQILSEEWKQPVVIENKGGASGTIGLAQVARTKADGYTLVMSSSAPHAVAVSLFPNVPYDPIKDFAPI